MNRVSREGETAPRTHAEGLSEQASRSPRDQAAHKMKLAQIVLRFLGPADQDSAEAIHPAMSAFDDPPARFEASLLLDGLSFFATATNMRGELELFEQSPHVVVIVPFVQAHSLGLVGRGLGTGNRNAFDRRARQLHVMSVGPINGDSDRDTSGLSEQAALDAIFGAIRRIGTGFFPPQAVPSSWRRPSTANPSRGPEACRIPEDLASKTPGRRQHRATPESGDERKNSNRFRSHPARSTGSRSATRIRSPPWHHGSARED